MRAVSRTRRWRLLTCVITAAVVTGCGGATPPAGSPGPSDDAHVTPRPDPTPTPEPGPWTSGWPEGGLDVSWEVLRDLQVELFDACYDGTPVPGAAPYAGAVHPLVVFDMNNAWLAYDVGINEGFRTSGWPWPSPIQLVVCARSEEKTAGSCGTYKSDDGSTGEVIRHQDTMTLSVVVAATGKALQKKVIKNPAPKCPAKVWVAKGTESFFVKNPVTPEQVDTYARSVSKQPVE